MEKAEGFSSQASGLWYAKWRGECRGGQEKFDNGVRHCASKGCMNNDIPFQALNGHWSNSEAVSRSIVPPWNIRQ